MQFLDKTGLEHYHSKIKDNLKSYYGTCSTAAGTQAKVVTCSGFKLETGAKISVKFTNAQTYNGTATLNVNSTGAKNITRVGTTTTTRYYWSAGEVIDFVYDGTNYIMEGKGTATTTYYGVTKLATSATSTSTSTALTPASLNNAMRYIVTGYAPYSTSSTYAVGDRVRYSNYVYECITAITTAEAWTEAHWKQVDDLQTQINDKQATLVSGTNIKTINGESLLGSGDITISGGGGGAEAVVIYDNSSGKNGFFSLTEVPSNFSYIDIFYKCPYGDSYVGSRRYDIANNTLTSIALDLTYTRYDSSSDTNYKWQSVTTISTGTTGVFQTGVTITETATATTFTETNPIYVTKVIGYR